MSRISKQKSSLTLLPRPQPETWFQHVKSLFSYSESIALARLDVAIGFAVAVLASVDYSPLLGLTTLDHKTVAYTGGVVMVKGVFTEWARRRNSTLNLQPNA